ncbi:MAG: N-acetylneuraminate synthase family protein [Deltaproteobacteria bacterium]
MLTRCQEKGIQILATPFDLDSIDLLVRLGLNLFKIPSVLRV